MYCLLTFGLAITTVITASPGERSKAALDALCAVTGARVVQANPGHASSRKLGRPLCSWWFGSEGRRHEAGPNGPRNCPYVTLPPLRHT
jgi:hypothetical protein